MLALDPATGRERWRINAGFNIFGPPRAHGDKLYFGTQNGKLFCVDRRGGDVRWTFATNGYTKNRHKFFKADDSFRDDIGKVVRGFNDYLGMLYSLGAIYSTPALTEHEIIITTAEGTVYCLEKE